jgi:hypothetical protein
MSIRLLLLLPLDEDAEAVAGAADDDDEAAPGAEGAEGDARCINLTFLGSAA